MWFIRYRHSARHLHLVSVVFDALVATAFRYTRIRLRCTDATDDELPLCRRAAAFAFAFAQGQHTGGVVVVHRDARVVTVLVAIRAAIVLVQREVGIATRIDADLCDGLLRCGRLDVGTQRHDGAGADEDGNLVDGRGHLYPAPARQLFVGPEVVPVAAGGQIDVLFRLALLGDRRHQEGGAEHVLRADVGDVGIVREVHPQRPHEGRAGVVGLPGLAVD